MLVLKRKLGEEILITTDTGKKIYIKVSDISDGRIKLAIDAPRSISILRKEVLDEASKENKEAAESKKIDKDQLKDIIGENKSK